MIPWFSGGFLGGEAKRLEVVDGGQGHVVVVVDDVDTVPGDQLYRHDNHPKVLGIAVLIVTSW